MKSLTLRVSLLVFSWPTFAAAQDAATAETLFREGRALIQDDNYAEACPKFAASQKLDPGLGTLLNLADCHEKLGMTASAWGEFLDAAYQAKAQGAMEHEAVARERARLLEAMLVRLTITVPQGVPNLVVMRSGQPVTPETFGVATPVDPGEIQVKATAPGYLPWSTAVVVDSEHNPVSVAVPALEPEPKPEPPPQPPVVATPEPAPAPPAPAPPPAPQSSWTGLHTAGAILSGVGVAGLGLGLGLTLTANADWNDANCPGNVCQTQSDQDLAEGARTQADVATVAWIAGGVVGAAGLSMLLFAPSGDATPADTAQLRLAPLASPFGGGIWIDGRF